MPTGTTVLRGTSFGNGAYAKQARLTISRAADGATLFTGSLARFHRLPVAAGTKLVVRVQPPDGDAGVEAGATLAWA